MKTNKKLQGDQGYERIILISMQVFTVIFFVTIIASNGDPAWIGGNAGVIIIYFFMLSNNRKDKVNAQQKKVGGIIHWESWTATSSEHSEFNVFGIKNMWKLTQISREQYEFVNKTIKMVASKPIPTPIELSHSETKPIVIDESKLSPETEKVVREIVMENLDKEEQNLVQMLNVPNLEDVLSTQDHIVTSELEQSEPKPESDSNTETQTSEEGLTDDQIPTVDYDPDEIKDKNEITIPTQEITPIEKVIEKNPEEIPSKPVIKKTNKKKRGKKQ